MLIADELRDPGCDVSRDGFAEAHAEVFLDALLDPRTRTKREIELEGSPSGEACSSKVLGRKLDGSLVVRRTSRRASELDGLSSRSS